MSDQTIVDVVINDSTATVVDNRDLSNLTIDLNATGQLLTNNLISSGNYLDSEIAIVSGIAQSGSNESLTGQINQLSGNLIITGQTLQTQITSNDSDINTLTTNLATTGDTLTSEINSISGVVPTGGATNQVLAKIDSTNYNTQWVNQSGGGGSGTVTSSTATTNYLTKWTNGAGEVIGNSILYDNGSNIGISTTSPSSKLHVEGTFKNTGETFLATDSTNEVIIGASITDGSLPNKFLNITGYNAFGIKLIGHGGWTKYLIQTGHDRKLRFYNDGTSSAATNQNFLFGTTSSASAKLTLFTKDASFIHLGINEPYPSAKFGVLNPTHDYKGDVYIDTASAAGAYKRFQFKNTGVFDTEAVNATSTSVNSYFSANVGIGTTSPSSKLHVNGMISAGIAGNNSANYAALLVSSTGTGTQQSAIAIQQTYPNGNTIIWADLEPYAEYNFSHDGIDNAFTFNSGYYANSLRGITIRNRSGTQRTSYEKVKIWQNTAQVDVGGAISIGQLGTGGETQPTIRLTIKDLQDSSFNSGIALVRSTNTDTAYINMVGGNLNFNAPTGASTQFKVAGTNTFAIAANGSISSSTGASLSSGGTWTDASTRELKQDIKDLDYRESLNIIKQLNPVKFAYKKDPKNKKIGFIAEDVPDLVATEDRKGLSALQIVSALTKVVQSQQKEIQQLKRMVKRLNNIK